MTRRPTTPPKPRGFVHRARRERTRDTDWWIEREESLTVQCPPYPRGCGRPRGEVCTDRAGEELVNQPAHDARSKRARAAEPTDHAAAPEPAEETS